MSGDIWDFSWWSGGLWPYAALLLFAVLPSEFWRIISIFLVRGMDTRSEALEWVRAVSTALLAAVVASIVIAPSGGLAETPLAVRVGALAAGLAAYWLCRRSVLAGVAVGSASVSAGSYLLAV